VSARRPRILVLSTGGTLAMRRRDPGLLAPSDVVHDVLTYAPGLDSEVDVAAEALWNLDSSDMGPEHWNRLALALGERMDHYDGFVVLHGTDTMAWTASALSFALRGLPKPVILTGAQRPIAYVRTDARQNLVHSALCAAMPIPEVGIYFGRWLFRGNRSTKTSIQGYEAFESPDCPPLVEMGVDVRRIETPLRPAEPFRVSTGFESAVGIVPVVPGSSPALLDASVATGLRGVLVEGFGVGNVPQRGWPGAIRRAVDAGVVVAVASQCARGRVDLSAYEGGRAAMDAGALGAGAMTLESATVKLMHLLARPLTPQEFTAAWNSDLAGEGAE
jgi:L-asparaginase